jgi:hypothetical protein
MIQQIVQQWPKLQYNSFDEPVVDVEQTAPDDVMRRIADAIPKTVENDTVSDRSFIDILAATLLGYHHGDISEALIGEAKFLLTSTIRNYDVIFYLQNRKEFTNTETTPEALEDNDIEQELDNILKSLKKTYDNGTGSFFPTEDCPAIISLEGPPDTWLSQVRLYIKDDCTFYGEEDGSLIIPDAWNTPEDLQ